MSTTWREDERQGFDRDAAHRYYELYFSCATSSYPIPSVLGGTMSEPNAETDHDRNKWPDEAEEEYEEGGEGVVEEEKDGS